MDPLTLNEIADLCGGALTAHDPGVRADRISKDTRTLDPGDIYLALGGENFDGNAFVSQAAAKGACAAITDRDPAADVPSDFPLIRVENTFAALQRFADAWRNRLDLKVVGITGSSGKTSTKEFTAAVLSVRYRVNKTIGNLNNHFGLPLTVLTASSSDQAAVWEIGMNHPGEVAPLAALARPDAAIVTNIGVAHIEFFGSLDGIAAEKAALIESLGPDGVAILPAADHFAAFLASRAKGRVIRTGLAHGEITAEIRTIHESATSFRLSAYGESANAQIAVAGEHMVRNALLAVAAGLEFGLSLDECAEGLRSARLIGGRFEQKLIRGIRIIDDSYNANPDSVEAALKAVASLPASGKRIAVLGRMGELGAYAETGYRRVGKAAAALLDTLIAVGPETASLATEARAHGLAAVHETSNTAEAAALLREIATEGDLILVKGSRAARMEQVITTFEQ